MDWSSWIQGLTQSAVSIYAEKEKAEAAYDVRKLELQDALTAKAAAAVPAAATPLPVSPMVLIAGGVALVALLVLSDRKG